MIGRKLASFMLEILVEKLIFETSGAERKYVKRTFSSWTKMVPP